MEYSWDGDHTWIQQLISVNPQSSCQRKQSVITIWMGIRTLLQTSRLTLSQAGSSSSQWLTGFERILWKGPSQLAESSTCQSRACSYQNFPVQNSYATWSVGGQDQYRPLPQARSSRISVSTFEMVSFKICNIKTIKRKEEGWKESM